MPTGQSGKSGGRGEGNGKRRMAGNRPGAGPGGKCLCPNCGAEWPHQQGKPCMYQICTECGSQMMRA